MRKASVVDCDALLITASVTVQINQCCEKIINKIDLGAVINNLMRIIRNYTTF